MLSLIFSFELAFDIDIYIMHVHNKAKTYYGRYYDIQVEGRFEVSNITLSVDDDIIKKVRKIAIDKNTTLTAMVRDYLTSVAARDTQEKNEAIKKPAKLLQKIQQRHGAAEMVAGGFACAIGFFWIQTY